MQALKGSWFQRAAHSVELDESVVSSPDLLLAIPEAAQLREPVAEGSPPQLSSTVLCPLVSGFPAAPTCSVSSANKD